LRGNVVGHADFGFQMEHPIDVVPDVLTVSGWHSEECGNHGGRQPGSEVLYVVEAVPPLLGVEEAGAELPDLAFELCHSPRRECLGNESTEQRVLGRVEEDHGTVALGFLRHHLQDGGVRRAVALRLPTGPFNILEPAQGPEVVLIVVVHGGLHRADVATPDADRS
jgi:hypothetical protein